MKKEKKVEGKIRVVILMVMMMGCNSGGKDPEKVFLSDIANLGKGFLDVFVSFGDMITGTLGIKADTKKSEIGAYFTKIENTMKVVKVKLGEILEKNGHYPKVKEKVEEFIGKISKIEEGAKEAASGASGDVIGNAKKGEDANPAEVASINALVKGIKEIVGIVLKRDEGNPGATKTAEAEKKSIGKLFGGKDNGGTEQQAAAASATIGAVSGVDILKAIASSAEAGTGEIKIEEAKNTAEIAASKKEDNKEFEVDSVKKDAIIAAGGSIERNGKRREVGG